MGKHFLISRGSEFDRSFIYEVGTFTHTKVHTESIVKRKRED